MAKINGFGRRIYRLTKLLPKEEIFGLTNQLRRAAISIPSNIAEGNTRVTSKEYARFLSIARASEAEIETQLEICVRIGYLNEDQIRKSLALCIEIGKTLYSMIRKLNNE
ncbi:MAG: four helix bundle protein [Anaerolineaceae bacterium]|jgi:four helix bundle protein|nr:four helix bundle protein [Anaerolineaceae bacterium]MDD4043420.1 four helix bundle protein [Anaerolineaceae bacterium]MDD4578257.1 four helix bundle protein [Anaerolineaceae bacterium]